MYLLSKLCTYKGMIKQEILTLLKIITSFCMFVITIGAFSLKSFQEWNVSKIQFELLRFVNDVTMIKSEN